MDRRNIISGVLAGAVCGLVPTPHAQGEGPDRPNILWLTFEDASAYMVGCYGNPQVRTPNMDALAAKGILYRNASSIAPACSPARSAIISGCQPAYWGHDEHRMRREADHPYYLFPRLLREAGYYTTNNAKTDYNNSEAWLKKNLPDAWDVNSNAATYNDPNRKPGQPFFAVFNTFLSHMNCIATIGRDFRETPRIPPDEVILPAHVPDLPEMRDDFAQHLYRIEKVDDWVGAFLEDLEQRGLADNTIVFVYSDHGGCLPRGKGFAFDSTSFHVPLIVYLPERWEHLMPDAPGTASYRLVDFTDLAPTVLALAGIAAPAHMHGNAFLGEFVDEGKKYQVNVRCNSWAYYDPARTVTDGRYVYLRNFIPYRADAAWQDYQWQMPSQRAWDRYVLRGKGESAYQSYYQAQPAEMLFDLQSDPYQVHDLADRTEYAGKIAELREVMVDWMARTGDKGMVPLQMRERDPSRSFYDRLSDPAFPLPELQVAALRAGLAGEGSLPEVREMAGHDVPEIRFWGAVGLVQLARKGMDVRADAEALLNDEHPDIAVAAAEALWFSGRQMDAFRFFLDLCRAEDLYAFKSFENLLLLDRDQLDPEVEKRIRLSFSSLAETGSSGLVQRSARAILTRIGALDVEEVYSEADRRRQEKQYVPSRAFRARM